MLLQNSNKKTSSGFTLIELLIVVVIIGILSGLVLAIVNSGGVRSKAHDSQRASDLKKIQAALELYFQDNRAYPVSASWTVVTGSDSMSTALAPDYISLVPTDPLSGSGSSPCVSTADDYRYNYVSNASGSSYVLTAIMEVDTSSSNNPCSSLNNWSSLGCNPPVATCYGVENP